MKKSILTSITVLSFIITQAQINKGAKALGFNLAATYNIDKSSSPGSFNSSNIELTKTNKVFAAQPFYEFFVGKNLSFGIGFNYGIVLSNEKLSIGTNFNSLDNSLNTYGLQFQFKKYWFATNRIAFTLTPALTSSYNESSYVQSNNIGFNEYKGNSDFWTFSFGGSLGAAYFIKPNIMIEGQTNFFSYSIRPEDAKTSSSNNLTISVIPTNLAVGVKFIFGNKASNNTIEN